MSNCGFCFEIGAIWTRSSRADKRFRETRSTGAIARLAASSALLRSVNDEQLRAGLGRRSVGCVSKVRHLIARAGRQLEPASILQLGIEFAFQDVEDVASVAPVISEVAGRVFHHPDPHITNVERSPKSAPGLA